MHKKKNIRHLIFPYYPIVIFFVSTLIFLSVFRLGLVLFHHGRIPGFSGHIKILVYGIRIDIVSSVYAIALPVLLTPFLEGYRIGHGLWQKILSIWLTIWAVIFVVMEFITPGYIKEYDVRPNRLFVEYLTYPKELVNMLLKGYLIHVLAGSAALILSVYLVYRFMTRLSHPASNWNFFHKLTYFPILAILLFLGARSSLGHRPINPSNVAFSSDSLVNDLALNSTYSLLYSVYRMKDEADAAKEYGSMDKDKMLGIVKKNSSTEMEGFSNLDIPTLHHLKATSHRKKPLNLVIILEESLGAEFVSNLGGAPVTPNLERLSKEGLWFNQLYATGTRSVVGIEAVVCGYPPTPARSVVKLGKSQKNFFTLAELLSKKGYETRFIYGGDSNFDNMKGFFLGNGFQKVIDEKDFDHPQFKGAWGVSDQDLFDKAHDYFMSRNGKPFFSFVFSSSNHPPYEFPDNTIELYEQPKATVHNAVKYADYALNEFFEKAKKSPYWANTLFLVVADHNAHVGGESLVPVPRFKIPALIIGPSVKPSVYNEIASQIDLPPTLLSIMGISCDTPMIGRDLTDKPAALPGRAILQFYKNQAYMTDEQVVILQPGEKINAYRYTDFKLIPDILNKNQDETALAHALWSSWTYKNSMYKVP
jgi:phosphoglycerol transferase MdoB-like AlkP superfamily enzyme